MVIFCRKQRCQNPLDSVRMRRGVCLIVPHATFEHIEVCVVVGLNGGQ